MSPEFWIVMAVINGLSNCLLKVSLIIFLIWIYTTLKDIEDNLKGLKKVK